MVGSELWVGVLTATTALATSFLTARGTSRAALVQARTTAEAQALSQERERRRATYREMMACVHSFMSICWQVQESDEAPDCQTKRRLQLQIYERMGQSSIEVTRATREVLLDGPADVSVAAEGVRQAVSQTQAQFENVIGADDAERRRIYDGTYQEFRDKYVAFIGLARAALEVKPGE